MEVSPNNEYGTLRHSSSFTPEDIAQIPDEKIERFKIMFEAMKTLETAEKDAKAAITTRNDTMKALDAARAAKAKEIKSDFMSEWRRTVVGKV